VVEVKNATFAWEEDTDKEPALKVHIRI